MNRKKKLKAQSSKKTQTNKDYLQSSSLQILQRQTNGPKEGLLPHDLIAPTEWASQ